MELGDLFEPLRVPDPDRPVAAGRDDAPSIRAEGDGKDLVRVAAQNRDRGASARVPDAQGAVTRARDQVGSVWTESEGVDRVVLNRSDWTIELNDAFIACVAACELGTCDPP